MLETVVGAHAEVILGGVDGSLGAETAVGGILWARCGEARVVCGVRDAANRLVLGVVDLMVASLEDRCRVEVICVALARARGHRLRHVLRPG